MKNWLTSVDLLCMLQPFGMQLAQREFCNAKYDGCAQPTKANTDLLAIIIVFANIYSLDTSSPRKIYGDHIGNLLLYADYISSGHTRRTRTHRQTRRIQ